VFGRLDCIDMAQTSQLWGMCQQEMIEKAPEGTAGPD
jgi:hypothetical protein